MSKKAGVLLLRVVGAAFGATGFVFLGVGGTTNLIIGNILIGIGGAFIATGS